MRGLVYSGTSMICCDCLSCRTINVQVLCVHYVYCPLIESTGNCTLFVINHSVVHTGMGQEVVPLIEMLILQKKTPIKQID